MLRPLIYPSVKYECLTTTTLHSLVKFLQIQNPLKFGIYLKTTKKSIFANSSLSCVLSHGQQDRFKLAFFAIKCFRTHSNTHLAHARLPLPSVTIGGMWSQTFSIYGYVQSCVACQKLICFSYYWDAVQCTKQITKLFCMLNFQLVRSTAAQYYRTQNSVWIYIFIYISPINSCLDIMMFFFFVSFYFFLSLCCVYIYIYFFLSFSHIVYIYIYKLIDVTIFVIWCLLLHVSQSGGNKVWMN